MIYCPNCGTENRAEARFCRECQTPLSLSSPEQQPPAPPPGEQPPIEEQPSIEEPLPIEQPPVDTKKSKTPLVIGIVAGIGCLCIVCLVIAVLLALTTDLFSFLPFFGAKWAASGLLPADTGFLISLDPGIEDLAGFQHLAEVYSGVFQEDDIDQFVKDMETELGVSFEDDVKPWLGTEVAAAMLNMGEVIDGKDPIMVVAFATRDRGASDAFLEKARVSLEEQDYVVAEETYQGVTYYAQQVELDWETPVVFGTVKKFVILATGVDAMHEVIDVSKGDADSLAKNEHYTGLLDVLPDDAVSIVYYDLQSIMGVAIEETGVELPAETMAQLDAFDTMGIALGLDAEGIQLDFAMLFDPDEMDPETLQNMNVNVNPGRILQRMPHDVLGFVSAQNLAAVWSNSVASMQANPDFAMQLDDFESATGLRVDEELFGWTTGEFALAVVESAELPEIPIGVFTAFEVDEQEAAETKMGELGGVLENLGGYEFAAENVGGVEMQVIDDPYMGITLGYGFSDQHLVIGFMRDALEVAVSDDILSVTDDESFKRVQAHLPDRNTGYFYVNVARIWQLVYENAGEYNKGYYDQDVAPWLDPIKAIGMAAPIIDPSNGYSQVTMFIYIP